MSASQQPLDFNSLAAALADITNTQPSKSTGDEKKSETNTEIKTETNTENKTEAEAKAQWVPREAYDYKLYNAISKEAREEIEANPQAELPDWAANAQKYEWDDEYGDIGPEHPELEKQLFGADFIVRSGQELEKSDWLHPLATLHRADGVMIG